MNPVILVAFTIVLSASLAFAQDTQSSAADSSSAAADFRARTFQGCLSLEGSQYELTVGGAAPRRYRLAGSNLAQLDGKTGHVVSITGTVPEGLPVSGTNGNQESDTINFLSVDDLGSACNASTGPGSAAQTPHSRAAASASAQGAWQSLNPFIGFLSAADPQSQPGSYMIVPLVGVFGLGLLHLARLRSKK